MTAPEPRDSAADTPRRPTSVGDAADRLGGLLARPAVAGALAALAGVVFAATSLRVTRSAGFFVDEMKFFTTDGGLRPSALLAPVNGHLSLVQRAVLGVDFRLFGADFVLVRVVSVLGVLLVAALLGELVRRRAGTVAGLAAIVLVLGLGPVWELTYVPSGVGVSAALVGGLGAFLALERGSRGGDAAACALLVLGGLAYTLAPAFMLGALVLLAVRREAPRRLWVALVPIALYLAWYAWAATLYVAPPGQATDLPLANLLTIVPFAADEAAAVAGVLTGLGRPLGDTSPFVVFTTRTDGVTAPLAVLLAVLLVLRVRRRGASPGLWAAGLALVAWWAELGLGAAIGRTPDTVRYAYAGVVLVVLVAAEAHRGTPLRGRAAVGLLALVAIALPANAARLREGVGFYRASTSALSAQLLAVELARDRVAPGFRAGAGPAGALQVTGAGDYLAAVDRIGASPALAPTDLPDAPEAQLAELDRGLVGALAVGLRRADRLAPAACRTVPAGPDGTVRLDAASPGLLLRAPTPSAVAVRRFARLPSTTVPVGALAPGSRTLLSLPADRAARPWRVTVASPGGVLACRIL